jgi:hypothetical protein
MYVCFRRINPFDQASGDVVETLEAAKEDAHYMLMDMLTNTIRLLSQNDVRGHHGRDRMVVGFTTTCAISLSPLTL